MVQSKQLVGISGSHEEAAVALERRHEPGTLYNS